MDATALPTITARRDPPYHPYPMTVDEFVRFRRDGFLVVKGLISRAEVDEFNAHTDAVMNGEISVPGLPAADQSLPLKERRESWERLHMSHRVLEIHERFLLHPRIIDVLEALIGPDVLALQTMLFFKQPGQAGQGYHQDAYYIPTQPDTLCGAWLALDPATEENGCLWFTVGSQHEPIYPDGDGRTKNGDRLLEDISIICNASNPDTEKNTLSRIAAKYPGAEVKVEAEPGDVVFFGGHVLHRSHSNRANYSRRAFVGHYCNARSRVPWNHGLPYQGSEANYQHILARGTTHLPYAQPKFGTLCAANAPELYGQRIFDDKPHSMMGDGNGFMITVPHGDPDHDE
jgi:ectoine hydroxylase-related dioxygenase (phytanoyl-CoA dioxygenase family)